MNMNKASNQWASRPDDERFESLAAMRAELRDRRERASALPLSMTHLSFSPVGESGLQVLAPTGEDAALTAWSFGQVCTKLEAPAKYLASLPATKAADLLNFEAYRHRRTVHDDDREALMLLDRKPEGLELRALTSQRYSRVWDEELLGRCEEMQARGWRVPPARPASMGQAGSRQATEADVLAPSDFGLSVKVGEWIAPAGLYAGDRDMFVFMVNEANKIDAGGGDLLSRGFFLENSEVGARSFTLTAFLYRHVCGNHIVWDARQVKELRLRHVGSCDERAFSEMRLSLIEYADRAASEDEARILRAKHFELAAKKEDVIDLIFGLGLLGKRATEEAYACAEITGDNPRSAWGLAQGITRLSQDRPFGDSRVTMDRAAGKVLALAS